MGLSTFSPFHLHTHTHTLCLSAIMHNCDCWNVCESEIPWFSSLLEGAVTSAAWVSHKHLRTHTLHVKWKGNIQEVAALWRQHFMFPSVEHLLEVRLRGLLGLSYSLQRVRGERSREQQYPLVTMTPGPRMFFCWFLVVRPWERIRYMQAEVLGYVGFFMCSQRPNRA